MAFRIAVYNAIAPRGLERFTAPRYADSGDLAENARITVIHNGTKVIDNLQLVDKAPRTGHVMLQDHGSSVRFRNIWLAPPKIPAN